MSLDEERPGPAPMMVRCHRCDGEAAVTAPFSQAPEISYPDALATQCEELKERRLEGRGDLQPEGCAALRRALTVAMGGRDD